MDFWYSFPGTLSWVWTRATSSWDRTWTTTGRVSWGRAAKRADGDQSLWCGETARLLLNVTAPQHPPTPTVQQQQGKSERKQTKTSKTQSSWNFDLHLKWKRGSYARRGLCRPAAARLLSLSLLWRMTAGSPSPPRSSWCASPSRAPTAGATSRSWGRCTAAGRGSTVEW